MRLNNDSKLFFINLLRLIFISISLFLYLVYISIYVIIGLYAKHHLAGYICLHLFIGTFIILWPWAFYLTHYEDMLREWINELSPNKINTFINQRQNNNLDNIVIEIESE